MGYTQKTELDSTRNPKVLFQPTGVDAKAVTQKIITKKLTASRYDPESSAALLATSFMHVFQQALVFSFFFPIQSYFVQMCHRYQLYLTACK